MDLFKSFTIFLLWKIAIKFNTVQSTENLNNANHTQVKKFQSKTLETRAEFQPLNECSLLPEFSNIGDKLAAMLATGSFEQVEIHLEITGDAGPYKNGSVGPMMHPGLWVLTTGSSGRAMLLLKENSEKMSLGTLSYGVMKLNISILQSPKNCLANLTDLQAENIVRRAILTGFGNSSVTIHEGAEVCSQYFYKPHTGDINLVYKCCSLSLRNTVDCYNLNTPAWQSILVKFIVVAVLIMTSNLIPMCFSKMRSHFVTYRFIPQSENRLVIRIQKLIGQMTVTGGRLVRTEIPSSSHFTDFKEIIDNVRPNIPLEITMERAVLSFNRNKLLKEGQSPVSIISFLWHFLIRCKLRREISSLRRCCDADSHIGCKKRIISWYACAQTLMYLIVFVLLCAPCIVRYVFYSICELKTIQHQQQTFALRNMTSPYTGGIVRSFPCIGGFIVLETLLWFVFSKLTKQQNLEKQKQLKRKLEFPVRKCLYDMGMTNVLDVFGECTKCAVLPFVWSGMHGIWVLFIWPLLFTIIVIAALPIANLSVRLFVNFIVYSIGTIIPELPELPELPACIRDTRCHREYAYILRSLSKIIVQEENKQGRKHNLITALALFFALATICCIMLLVTECIIFYVECAVYTLIGIILNPSDTMSVFAFVLWITVYCYDCFTSAHFAYSMFCKTIHAEIRDTIDHKEIEQQEMENTAFQVPSTRKMEGAEHIKLVCGSDGVLQWNAPRVCFFLDRYHIPYISKRMVFEMANIDHSSCPQKLHIIYLNSLLDFIKVVVFLLFSLVVIKAVGEAQNLYSGMISIALFASGLVPLAFRKAWSSTHENPSVEKNREWKKALRKAIEEYKQNWALAGIQPVKDQEEEMVAYDCRNDSETLVQDTYQTQDEPELSDSDQLVAQAVPQSGLLYQESHPMHGVNAATDFVVVQKTKDQRTYYEYYVLSKETLINDKLETIV